MQCVKKLMSRFPEFLKLHYLYIQHYFPEHPNNEGIAPKRIQ